jgi:nucleotide-binding universal stress UspA family protein
MSGDRLLAVMAWQVPAPVHGSGIPRGVDFRRQAEATLSEAIKQSLGDQHVAAIDTLIEEGHPALVLAEEARYADLLVVGNRGQGEFDGMLLGSVSEYCVSHAPCPVVVVPVPPTTQRDNTPVGHVNALSKSGTKTAPVT